MRRIKQEGTVLLMVLVFISMISMLVMGSAQHAQLQQRMNVSARFHQDALIAIQLGVAEMVRQYPDIIQNDVNPATDSFRSEWQSDEYSAVFFSDIDYTQVENLGSKVRFVIQGGVITNGRAEVLKQVRVTLDQNNPQNLIVVRDWLELI
jgi:type II secretory pathway component PulK